MMPGPRILQWIIVRYNALCLPVQVPKGYNWLGYFSRFADEYGQLHLAAIETSETGFRMCPRQFRAYY